MSLIELYNYRSIYLTGTRLSRLNNMDDADGADKTGFFTT